MDTSERAGLVELTAEIVSAYVTKNEVRPDQLSTLIGEVQRPYRKRPRGRPSRKRKLRNPLFLSAAP